MTYQAELKKRIAELEAKITIAEVDKSELERELQRLKIAEFEEELQEEGKQSLLKGSYPFKIKSLKALDKMTFLC